MDFENERLTLDMAIGKYGEIWWSKIREIYKLLILQRVPDVEFVRIGNSNDGGYLMLDDFDASPKVAYSFGISNDTTWDGDMADRGYEIYMYDHTINKLPEERREFHWKKRGLADSFDYEKGVYGTICDFIKENGHDNTRNMILKMDVEGAEWGGMAMTPTRVLNQFDQILIELHDMVSLIRVDQIIATLKHLNKTHQIVHIHANNYGWIRWINDVPFCWTYEVTYAKREKYSFVSADEITLPHILDEPCAKEKEEICLGKWNERCNSYS